MEYLHFLYVLGKRRRGGGLVPNWSVPMNRPTSHEDSRSIPKTGLKPKLAMQTSPWYRFPICTAEFGDSLFASYRAGRKASAS